jgi:hypothetical protein
MYTSLYIKNPIEFITQMKLRCCVSRVKTFDSWRYFFHKTHEVNEKKLLVTRVRAGNDNSREQHFEKPFTNVVQSQDGWELELPTKANN